jgi:hypothetical protein
MNMHSSAMKSFTKSTVARQNIVVLGAAIGAGLGLTANTLAFGLGALIGPVRVITGSHPHGTDLTYTSVALATIVSIAAGGGLLWPLVRRRADGYNLWTAIAVTVAVLSCIPLWGLDIGTTSKLVLTTMHILAGASAIIGQHAARRRLSARQFDEGGR